jgi:hypothetical protein
MMVVGTILHGRGLDLGSTYIALENWFLVAIIKRVVP